MFLADSILMTHYSIDLTAQHGEKITFKSNFDYSYKVGGKGNVILTNIAKEKFPHNSLLFFFPSYPIPFRYVKKQVVLQPYSNKILNFWAFSIGINWLNSSPWVGGKNICGIFKNLVKLKNADHHAKLFS